MNGTGGRGGDGATTVVQNRIEVVVTNILTYTWADRYQAIWIVLFLTVDHTSLPWAWAATGYVPRNRLHKRHCDDVILTLYVHENVAASTLSLEGYIIPLDITNGLVYMRSCAIRGWMALPHVHVVYWLAMLFGTHASMMTMFEWSCMACPTRRSSLKLLWVCSGWHRWFDHHHEDSKGHHWCSREGIQVQVEGYWSFVDFLLGCDYEEGKSQGIPYSPPPPHSSLRSPFSLEILSWLKGDVYVWIEHESSSRSGKRGYL